MKKFDSLIQEAVYRKVQQFLYELYGRRDDVKEVPQSAGFRVIKGSAVVYIDVTPLGENEASVTAKCSVVSGARITRELMDFLLRENAALKFGAFGIDSCGDIIFSHSIVGSTLNREELRESVLSVANVSDTYDDKLIEEFGGTTSLSRLHERETPKAPAAAGDAAAEKLLAFLESKGVRFISTGVPRDADAVLDPIASLLGKNYEVLEPLCSSLKRAMNRDGRFTLSLEEAEPERISVVTQFCTMLYRNAILAKYWYSRAPKRTISAAVQVTDHRIRHFFTGEWLERYARNLAEGHMRRSLQGKAIECLNNTRVRLPSGQDFEFDLLFCGDSVIIWVECKSGRYQEHIARYREIGDSLEIPAERRILILGDPQEEETRRNLSTLYRLVVLSPEDFGAYLEEVVGGMTAKN